MPSGSEDDVEAGDETKKFRVQSVARASAILFAVARQEQGLSRKEISKAAGLPTQTTYHLLHTLSQLGLLTRNDQNNYVLGMKVGSLAEGFRRQLGGSRQISHLLRQIARTTGETTYAARWIDGEVVSVEIVRGHHSIQALELPHGFSEDAHSRSGGKVLLAHATDLQRDEYFRTHKLRKRTPKTINSISELTRQFAEIREQGYAVEREEFAEGLCCVGVPLDEGLSPYAIGVSAPTERFNVNLDVYIETLKAVVGSIHDTI
ncbi:IclR family transcriptional regulator [Novosphingobium lentum]|uniref:IclR family transcriptional regulator n=1 Tax=Novosphingobium lentum TaxID=145287 RepID=UPI000830D807|nr:IclR family transcriptional regulator [Novosphingobium lentum]